MLSSPDSACDCNTASMQSLVSHQAFRDCGQQDHQLANSAVATQTFGFGNSNPPEFLCPSLASHWLFQVALVPTAARCGVTIPNYDLHVAASGDDPPLPATALEMIAASMQSLNDT